MDQEKRSFLFAEVPPEVDLEDPPQVAAWFMSQEADNAGRALGAVRAVVADQVLKGDPPEVWQTAKRLLGLGLKPAAVLEQITAVLAERLSGMSRSGVPEIDLDAYRAELSELPLPGDQHVKEATISFVREHQPLPMGKLDRLLGQRFERDPQTGSFARLADRIFEDLLDERTIELLAGDLVVHLPDLTSGMVLTHRLTAAELADGLLDAGVDLAPLNDREELRVATGPIDVGGPPGEERWWLPEGTLDAFQEGDVIAVSVRADGTVRIEAVPTEPPGPGLVDALRGAYEKSVEEPDVPAEISEVVYELLAEDKTAFAEPRAPLSELLGLAGLEVRGRFVAHEERLWENQRQLQLLHRVWREFEYDEERADAVLRVLRLAKEETPDRTDLKRALKDLTDPEVADFVAVELADRERAGVSAARQFPARLIRAAGEGMPKAVAHWFAAMAAEHAGEPALADSHLKAGLAAGSDWDPLLRRAAWYASDRGDASAAAALLRRTKEPPLGRIRFLSERGSEPERQMGRNEPCWCGSGRKYKQCHLNQAGGLPPLPDRFTWLCIKAAWFLEFRRPQALEETAELAELSAVDPDDEESFLEALEDPILMDLVLHEGGWFHDFLTERGPLLPEDELLLAQSWSLRDRSVFEVEQVRPGSGCTARDLATGDRFDVRERTFSRHSSQGWLVCARVVPDGETNQFIGGLFRVDPGTEEQVLDLCADGDPQMLAQWVGRLRRPPRLQTREGEEMVACSAVWEVDDPAAATQALDGTFQAQGSGQWADVHQLSGEDNIVRAQLNLEGNRLSVETMSEERMDRVLEFLRRSAPGRLLTEQREPVDMASLMQSHGGKSPEGLADSEELRELTTRLQEQMEDRWMREPVPALAGLTPQEAAADPTRRELLDRLLAQFEEMVPPEGPTFSFRVDRLRRELGMDRDRAGGA